MPRNTQHMTKSRLKYDLMQEKHYRRIHYRGCQLQTVNGRL